LMRLLAAAVFGFVFLPALMIWFVHGQLPRP
jgi:hypothetical protein